jgi:hypothetical protein
MIAVTVTLKNTGEVVVQLADDFHSYTFSGSLAACESVCERLADGLRRAREDWRLVAPDNPPR